jgi:hypothetical protein
MTLAKTSGMSCVPDRATHIAAILDSWGLSVLCPTHKTDAATITAYPGEVDQFAYCDVEYECGCIYHRTPFELRISTKV